MRPFGPRPVPSFRAPDHPQAAPIVASEPMRELLTPAARTTVDVRAIAATNRNLAEMVSSGAFREDLLYRLRVIHLSVPPLRERIADIRPLAMHFFARSGRLVTLTDDAWQALERYRWPGNVRELQNIVEQMAWLAASPDDPLGLDQVPAVVKGAQSGAPVRERRRQ